MLYIMMMLSMLSTVYGLPNPSNLDRDNETWFQTRCISADDCCWKKHEKYLRDLWELNERRRRTNHALKRDPRDPYYHGWCIVPTPNDFVCEVWCEDTLDRSTSVMEVQVRGPNWLICAAGWKLKIETFTAFRTGIKRHSARCVPRDKEMADKLERDMHEFALGIQQKIDPIVKKKTRDPRFNGLQIAGMGPTFAYLSATRDKSANTAASGGGSKCADV